MAHTNVIMSLGLYSIETHIKLKFREMYRASIKVVQSFWNFGTEHGDDALMCKISRRLGKWEISHELTNFREISVQDEFRRD